jgi:hypothetical protein
MLGSVMIAAYCTQRAPGRLWPWSLRATTMFFIVVMSNTAWVPCVAFGLHAHVPLASLMTCLGFRTLALFPRWTLGRDPSSQGSRSCHGGFHGGLLLVDPGVDRAKG